jgi:hypothetical protein
LYNHVTSGEKNTKYAPLVAVGQAQADKKERVRPVFLPAVFSNDGELSPGFFALIEYIAMQAKMNAQKFPERDGSTASQVAARVRTQLKDAIACAIARGVGRLMRTGGFPLGGSSNKKRSGGAGSGGSS